MLLEIGTYTKENGLILNPEHKSDGEMKVITVMSDGKAYESELNEETKEIIKAMDKYRKRDKSKFY